MSVLRTWVFLAFGGFYKRVGPDGPLIRPAPAGGQGAERLLQYERFKARLKEAMQEFTCRSYGPGSFSLGRFYKRVGPDGPLMRTITGLMVVREQDDCCYMNDLRPARRYYKPGPPPVERWVFFAAGLSRSRVRRGSRRMLAPLISHRPGRERSSKSD